MYSNVEFDRPNIITMNSWTYMSTPFYAEILNSGKDTFPNYNELLPIMF